jgi:hypothetical protein
MQALRLSSLPMAACGFFLMTIASPTLGQESQFRNAFSAQPVQNDSTTTPAMKYFGSRLAARTRPQSTRKEYTAPQPVQTAGAKPFQSLQRGATLSPYLGLDIRSDELSIPNYYTFVRPQQQLQLSNKSQTLQVRRLKEKLRLATSRGIVSNNPSGGVPTTGHSSQFLNLGGYFPAPR